MKLPSISTTLFLGAAAAASSSNASSNALALAAASSSEYCPTIYADFVRRQLAHFSPEGIFIAQEGESQKHTPFLSLSEDGKSATVIVGNGDEEGGVYHPMTASTDPSEVHFITHILVKDQDDNFIVNQALDPTAEAPATITFAVPAGVTEMVAYEWCNKHGLWAGPAVQVPTSETETVLQDTKSLATSDECTVSHFPEGAWPSVHADFLRLQAQVFESETPFTEADGVKHTPYITVNEDGTSSILVGEVGVAIHPMNGSPDGNEPPHWITEIYVVDQDGKIVAMKSLDPTGVTEATMDFDTPESATTLQAYAWCNIHGLYEGPVTEVGATKEAADADETTVTVLGDGSNSGTTAAVSLSVIAIASAVTLTALKM